MEKWIRFGLYVAASMLLFVLFQQQCAYDFFYAEQLRSFFFSEAYAQELLSQPGGGLEYVASFLIQFYVYDYIGPLVTFVLFFLLVWLCDKWLDKCGLSSLAPLGSVLLGGLFIILELDMEYKSEGTLAIIMSLAILNLYIRSTSFKLRLGLFALCIPLFYWMMGPAILALVACVCLWETGNRNYGAWALMLWGVLPLLLWWHWGECGEERIVFLPDAYYNLHLVPQKKLYYPWYLLLIIAFVASAWRLFRIKWSFKKWTPVMSVIQVAVGAGCFLYLFNFAHGSYLYQMKRLDCYRVRGEWDKILSEDLLSSKNEMHACYQNLALAQKGVLADSLFHYPQCPPSGLALNWNGSRQQADLLSDIFWLQGNVSLSQKMAFDAMYFSRAFIHPRLMLRLVETNLVLGEYGVAEKYIRLCEQSHYYADKATEYRKYLPKEGQAVAEGGLMDMRNCLPQQEDAVQSNFYNDLKYVLLGDPNYQPAVHYLGCKLLLDNNLDGFKYFVENVCDVKQLGTLPLHFQEAFLLIYDEEQCREYGVTEPVIARYNDFKKRIAGNKTRENAAAIFRAGFNKTFWVHSFIYQKNNQ